MNKDKEKNKMLLIGIKNPAPQTVLADGLLALGTVYRRYCRKNNLGIPTFSVNGNSITLQQEGMYHVTATFVAAGSASGDLTVQLLENGEIINGALATETVVTPTTELHNLVIDYYVLVDSACILGRETTVAKSISFENTGVDAIYSNAVINITKEV